MADRKSDANIITVRWWDGYMEEFEAEEVRFGCDLLWMRLTSGQNRHIPMRHVRWFGMSRESHQRLPEKEQEKEQEITDRGPYVVRSSVTGIGELIKKQQPYPQNSVSFGRRVSEQLDRIGMTQRELADKLGITEVAMSRIIRNERMPFASVIASIANILGVSLEYLLMGEEDDD